MRMLVGNYSGGSGATATNASANTRYGSTFTLDEDRVLSKVTARLDGQGSASGGQSVRALVYRDGSLLAQSDEVVVADGAAVAYVDFDLDPVSLPADDYHLALHFGPTGSSCRFYDLGTGTNLSTTSDTYSDGPASSISPTLATGGLVAFLTTSEVWQAPTLEDADYARYGFGTAQAVLAGPADPRTRRIAVAGWHGTYLDPEPQGASLAVVQSGGDLSDLVGERLLVRAEDGRSVVVYVHRETDLDLDDGTQISLTRRAWQAIATLATDSLLVTVETISGGDE